MTGETVRDLDAGGINDPGWFRRNVVADVQPVVLRGLCRDWPVTRAAAHSWSDLVKYLKQFERGQTAQAFVGRPAIDGRYYYGDGADGFNFEREEMTLAQGLERMALAARDPELSSVYLGSLPAAGMLPGYAEANPAAILGTPVEPRLWLGNRSNVACHFDTFDNLACVVAGRRRFTLYPPEVTGSLYVGPLDHTMAGQPVAMAVGSTPGDPRYPRFDAVRDRALTAELEPGDALYLPKLWWHQVEATGPLNLLVNYWWDAFSAGPDAPFTTMMLAMIAIAERPARERQAWRAFFDHYVFRPNGHPLAHLPEAKHGILGPLKAGNYRRVRTMVMQLLRGG
ncbi:cupin-like domain-containing protein [Stakelama sediminis]|uniref:JmjC domain-containing protein n=1 Tax=Stakelama sediminis TaxID=463200 RepID=A0A840YYN3_9SPHN|nr:cupin-like domain-containing protein [Stakelama sediminis]MBB5718626.1 hypothetical protein [Stakelama sediminis]